LFDEENLVSCAGLVPVMALAEQAGLSALIDGLVAINATRVRSAAVNPAGKLTSIVAGKAAGADSIDDLDVIRCGGMPGLFGGVYAPATMGQFTHGHSLQLASVARGHLVALVERTGLAACWTCIGRTAQSSRRRERAAFGSASGPRRQGPTRSASPWPECPSPS
jgi:hypothetical protein